MFGSDQVLGLEFFSVSEHFPLYLTLYAYKNGSLLRYQCRYQYTEGSSALKLLRVALKFILVWMWKACNSITEILRMTQTQRLYHLLYCCQVTV